MHVHMQANRACKATIRHFYPSARQNLPPSPRFQQRSLFPLLPLLNNESFRRYSHHVPTEELPGGKRRGLAVGIVGTSSRCPACASSRSPSDEWASYLVPPQQCVSEVLQLGEAWWAVFVDVMAARALARARPRATELAERCPPL